MGDVRGTSEKPCSCKQKKFVCPGLEPCPECPRTCKRRPIAVSYTLPRLPPLCANQYCPGPALTVPSIHKTHRCAPTPTGYMDKKVFCPAIPSRSPPTLESLVKTLEESRCRAHQTAEACKQTGYQTVERAIPIPRWGGFQPRYIHPIPQSNGLHPCQEMAPSDTNTYCCPEGCTLCADVKQGKAALCFGQLHPYIPCNQVEKIIRTW